MENNFGENYIMDNKTKIVSNLADNITRLMSQSISLNTIEKVAKRAGIGTGTVERIKKGAVSTTVDKLEALAEAFGVAASTLIVKNGITLQPLSNQDIRAVIRLMESTDDKGKAEILSKAQDVWELRENHLRLIGKSPTVNEAQRKRHAELNKGE